MDAIVAFFTRNGFLFELLVAYLPFTPFFKPKKFTLLRLIGCFLACLVFSEAFMRLTGLVADTDVLQALYVLYYVSVAVLTVLSLRFSFAIDIWTATFFGTAAYLCEHIFYRLKTICKYVFYTTGFDNLIVSIISYIALAVLLYGIIYLRVRKVDKEFSFNNKKLIVTSLLTILVVVVLCVVTSFATDEYKNISPPLFSVVTIAIIVCCNVILNNLFYNIQYKQLRDEKEIVTALYENEKKQYELSRQTRELLNIRYHDLKAFLNSHACGSGGAEKGSVPPSFTEEERAESLRLIDLYGSFVETGNAALDVILSEKQLRCKQVGIDLIIDADGSLLSSLSEVEVYSIFGNALDNAIESILRESPEDKTVTVTVKRLGDMCVIRVENYIEDEPKIVDGLPVTKKADKNEHGYGTKSIRRIVNMHDGFLKFSTDSHRFILEIIYNL